MPKRVEGADQRLFEAADVVDGAEAAAAEVEDRVADELAGAVEGDVAAAVGLDDLGAAGSEGLGVYEQVLGADAAAEGVDRRVLEEGEGFFAAGADGVGGRLLPAQGGGVFRDGPAVERGRCRSRFGQGSTGDPSP